MKYKRKTKIKIFISSAIKGLEDLRSEVIRYLRQSGKWSPIVIDKTTMGKLMGVPNIKELCLTNVKNAKWFLLVIDKRYGIPDYRLGNKSQKLSLTECEYIIAQLTNKKIVPLIRDNVWTVYEVWTTNPKMNFRFDSSYECPEMLMKFIARVKKDGYKFERFQTSNDVKELLRTTEPFY